MAEVLQGHTRLYVPLYQAVSRQGLSLLIDPEAPHWVASDARGLALIRSLDGRKGFSEIVAGYCRKHGLDWAKGWLHCQSFLQEALRVGFISTKPFVRAAYPGRSEVLELGQLSDLWLHVTNACNLSCEHCLVDSSPSGIAGGDTDFWLGIIDQARALGVWRFYITGGEPFHRADIFELIDRILAPSDRQKTELIILTNGMLFRGAHLKRLSQCDPTRIQFQISLDGPRAEINNPIRGQGSFDAAVRGMKEVISLGFSPTLTTVVNRANLAHMEDMVHLAASLGIQNIHLLLSHHRGRGMDSKALSSPSASELLEVFQKTRQAAAKAGITFDNYEVMLGKLMGKAGVKLDLSNAAYESLCVYADGFVYPSAALAGMPALKMGDARKASLEDIWRRSPLAKSLRRGTVQKKAKCKDCYLKYLCGGGDLEHSYLYSGQFMGEDPFSDFYEQWMLDMLFSLAEKKARQKTASGYDRPVLFASMGADAVLEEDPHSGAERLGGFEVSLSKSACVLSVDLDHSRRVVSDFYGDAAEEPQPALCCPGAYPMEDSAHIPKEVLEIAYGCGSPVGLAGIQAGEVMVDLGSGGGIDCFIASKKVGASGSVVGIDMTDRMLNQARVWKRQVAENLGYDNLSFKKGYLEDIPLPDQFADLITSNCVVNLSPDKKQVFVEMWRVLKDFGRIVISDTITEVALPEGMRANPRLWGECVSGALTESEYLAKLEQAGFYGLSVIKKTLWKEVEGYRFFSAVIRGYKYEKKAACTYVQQRATYLGPMQAVMDEEGHLFPRDQAVEVCTDTAAKLQKPPYQGAFVVTSGDPALTEGEAPEPAVSPEPAISIEDGCCSTDSSTPCC